MERHFSFQSYEEVRPYLICRLIQEREAEMMKELPFAQAFCDLAVISCIYRKNEDGTAVGCPVTFSLAEKWRVSPKYLIRDALCNMEKLMPPRFYEMDALMKSPISGSVRNVLLGLLRKKFPDTGEAVLDQVAQALTVRLENKFREESGLKPMWVLGNDAWMYGAVSLLFPGVLENFAERAGGNFYILPSSIHEVILLPEGGSESREQLYEMTASANRCMTDRSKVLSNNVYYFDIKRTKIYTL